jgi:hypothetical protein
MAPFELVKKPCDLAKSFECNVITKTLAMKHKSFQSTNPTLQ